MFYDFRQNNSGGNFHPPAVHVIIEADSAEDANCIAEESVGLYFNGCDDGRDCSCCGDRWYPAYDSEGTEVPECYGQPPEKVLEGKYAIDWSSERVPMVVCFYLDGGSEILLGGKNYARSV